MKCTCKVLLEAMGQPNCQLIPERVKRFIFTPSLEERKVEEIEPFFPTPPYGPPYSANWPQMYALTTPILDVVNSERAEPIRETLGENQYYVRDAARSFTAIVARRGAELGRLIDQLRCSRELGVFLVDANGLVWGARHKATPYVAYTPIPVNAPTVYSRMIFASADAVQKYEFSFELASSFYDYELVPIWEWGDWATYRAPIGVKGVVAATPSGHNLFLYALHADGVNSPSIPIDNMAPHLEVQNPNGTPQAGVSIVGVGGGGYVITGATAPFQVVVPSSQLTPAWGTQPGFDWRGFKAVFP